jgi:beta-glucosidase
VTFRVPTTRFAFSDRRLVRIVEPGEVQVWAASHAAASVSVERADSTGGAISNARGRADREVPGTATRRSLLTIVGAVHEVTATDARYVEVEVAVP